MNHIKFTKNVEWMRDYVECVQDLVPLYKLKRISGYSIPLTKVPQTDAQITKWHPRRCTITIRVTDRVYEALGENVFISKAHVPEHFAFLLDSLAHELAHLTYWEHVPEHLELQTKLLMKFARLAKKKGIKDTYSKVKV